MTRSHDLFQPPNATFPAASIRRCARSAASAATPVFFERGEGAYLYRRRRQALHRLRRLLGSDDRWALPIPRCIARGAGSGRKRPGLRRADRDRNAYGGHGVRAGAVAGNGAHGQFRHRSDDERHPSGARLHRPRQDRQVRGLLSRPFRLAAGQGRLRRAHPRRAHLARRARGAGRTHPDAASTTTWSRSRETFAEIGAEIACIIVEPVAGNMNCVPPGAGLSRRPARGLRPVTARC